MTDKATSWPLAKRTADGGIVWHIAGTNPPEYAPDPYLERLWRAAHARTRPIGNVIQLALWDKAA